ncbi:MAG: ATP-dependent helicase [Candidatus Eisenbacteria bacterium]|nr:ATP-dependent helicase [Candidatus Eisenbacteria bacterium]
MSAPGETATGESREIHEALEGLNEPQLEAVTHGEGPLMIVAGAGTGKTAVITRRIAWLIATRRARPEEILALTFTDKAAAEMEARVDERVPYGFTGATISTFHSFCDRLVREHAIELGLTSQLRVEQPAEILVFLRERIFELGLARYRPLGAPDTHLEALVRVFDRARDEDVSPEQYLAFAAGLAAAAASDADRDRAESELEKARAYAAYQRLLLEHGRVDFGSQISLALRLLRERPHVRREVQSRYRWILVDEFQDTNHVQFELVKLLAARGSEERGSGNLAVVGDDDQSIYRFRGAKVENLLGFLGAFPSAKVVLLKDNYRSGQRILDVAHRAIQFNNPGRLEASDAVRFDKRLRAARDLPGEVVHQAFATGADEVDAVTAEIASAIASGDRRPSELAILARAHSQLESFALGLRARGVPFQRRSSRGLYSRPEVLLCLNLLRTLADPDDGPAAFGVLGDPLFGVAPLDLLQLTAAANRTRRGLLRAARGAAEAPPQDFSAESLEALRRFFALWDVLAEQATRRRTSEVLYAFVTESGLLGRLSQDESAEAAERVQNLNKLFGIVQRVGPLLRGDRVPEFVGHLDLLIEAGDDPQAATADTDEEAVQLLTAHNAKGLEFGVVWLVQLAEGRFPMRAKGGGLPFPPELTHGGADPGADHEREERRLFFVGLTRARDRLVLTSAEDYGGKRTVKLSKFVVEALRLPAPPKTSKTASAEESIRRFAPAAEAPAAGTRPLADDEPLTLSHGQIDDYLTCPLKYRYAHVVRVPLASDPQAMYGIAIHHAIRVFLQHRLKGLPIEERDVIAAFEGAWSSEGFYSVEHEDLRLEEGRESLRRFMARESASGRLPLAVEMEFRFAIGRDVVSGRWDRIEETAEGIVLVDYKTGEVSDQAKADERAKESLKEGQLGLYALAYRETRRKDAARVQLHFVGSGLVGSADVAPKHHELALERISRASAGIRRAEFPATPDQRNCGFCPYSRFCLYSAARR